MKNKKLIYANTMENSIVLLDMGISSLSIVNKIKEKFPNESICYINDLEYGEYEGHDSSDIRSRIKRIVEFIASNKPKLLFILNGVFIEYGEEYFEGLDFPVLNIVKTTIDYVNSKYEYKSIAFLANEGIIQANLYQKNFRYNHLYSVKNNGILEIINNKMIKTKESFNAIRDVQMTLNKRDVEIIVSPEINMLLLYTEFGEYFKDVDLVRTDEAILEAIDNQIKKVGESKDKKYKIDLFLYFDEPQMYREKDAFRKLLNSDITYEIIDYSIKKQSEK